MSEVRSSSLMMSRRMVLRGAATLLVGGIGAGLLTACGGDSESPAATVAPETDAGDATTETGSDEAGSEDEPTTEAPAEEGSPVRGGTLTAAVQNDWVTMDPIFNTAEPTGFAMIYDQWINWVRDPDSGVWGPEPWLVESWELGNDEAVLTLRTGVTFHDGTPWDAEAAKWNLDRMIFHPASGMRARFTGVDVSNEDEAALGDMEANPGGSFDFSSNAVEVVDDRTVRIRLANPMGSILSVLSMANGMPISPTAYNDLGRDEYSRNPVGTGPMVFVEWQAGNQVIVERNPDYWLQGADGDSLPYFDQIIYRLIIDDSVRLLDLRSGNIQFTELIQGRDIEGIRTDPNLEIVESESQGNNYRLIFDSTNENSPFVRYPDLRKAILYSLDREAMLQTLGFGAGSVRHHLLPVGSFAYPEDVPFYSYDPDEAERLVQETIEADPSITTPEGRIPFTLTVIQRAVDQQQAEMIKQFADSVGFDTTIDVLERAAWTATLVQTPGQEGGEFEVATMRNPVTADDPDGQWRTFYHSEGSFNVAHIADPELDALMDEAAASYDDDERRDLYRELAQIAYDDPWYGFMWQQNWNWAFTSNFRNFVEPVTNQWDFRETWLE